MDKLLDEIESYWSTRTEGYSEVNEKELKGMQKKAWLETLERGFFGKRSGKDVYKRQAHSSVVTGYRDALFQ